MMYISDESIDRWIKEDIPYMDLTTHILGIEGQQGSMRFTTREYTVLAGVEEALGIFDKLRIKTILSLPSGTVLDQGETFLTVQGSAASLHMAWRVTLNLLEYCSGIATRTRKLVDKAKACNPTISIFTTRKSFPGSKELAVKSILAGGAYPHRLGLSETILIFKQHLVFLNGLNGLPTQIKQLKAKACEKKIIVEVETAEDALFLAKAGIDGLQFDKMKTEEVKQVVREIKRFHPSLVLIAAGGIREENVEEFAATGVDAIATSSVFFGKPSDIGVIMEKR